MEKENFQIEVLNTQEERGRFHQDAELLYILEGAMELTDGESRVKLPAQGIYVVNGGRKYSFRASDDILFARLTLPTQLVCRNDAAALAVFWCDSTREDNSRYDELRGVIKRLLDRSLGLGEQGGRLGYLALWFPEGAWGGQPAAAEYYAKFEILYQVVREYAEEMEVGGCGLLSKDGVMKAAGHAFRFLSWLYPHFAGRGENYLVITDRHDSYAIACHNQKMLNHRYYLSREDEIQRENIWKYFDDRDALSLSLRLTGVADGAYQVKTHQINEQAGDALQTWGELGFERELSRNDIQYLKSMCGPKLTIQTLEAQGGILPLHLRLEANEIRFVRVRRLG